MLLSLAKVLQFITYVQSPGDGGLQNPQAITRSSVLARTLPVLWQYFSAFHCAGAGRAPAATGSMGTEIQIGGGMAPLEAPTGATLTGDHSLWVQQQTPLPTFAGPGAMQSVLGLAC